MIIMESYILLIFVTLCSCVHVANSSCARTRPTGTDHCIFKDRVFALGSTYTDYEECIRMDCLKDGTLLHCGIGIKAGVFAPPPGCAVIRGEKCAAKLVDMNDNSMECRPKFIG